MKSHFSWPASGTAKVQLVPGSQFRNQNYTIKSAKDVDRLIGADMRRHDREHLVVIYLTSRNKVIDLEIAAIGALNGTVISPREVFKGAVLANAAAIILVHNHPSGDCEPSYQDKLLTQQLFLIGKFLGIPVHDSIIIGDHYYSFLENGELLELWQKTGRVRDLVFSQSVSTS